MATTMKTNNYTTKLIADKNIVMGAQKCTYSIDLPVWVVKK